MKYLKTYENSLPKSYNSLKIYFENKFIVVSPHNDTRSYVLEVLYMQDNIIYTKKLYTLYPDVWNIKNKKIVKNNQQNYLIKSNEISSICFYYSDNVKDAYDVLESLINSDKYNL